MIKKIAFGNNLKQFSKWYSVYTLLYQNIKNKKGTTLIISYLVIVVLLILGIAFTIRSIVESRIAERQKRAVQAFDIAEAGLERALYDLKRDFENTPSPGDPSWQDDTIYTSDTEYIDLSLGGTLTLPQDYPNFYLLPYGTEHDYNVPPISTSLGNGSFIVELANVSGKDDEIWVESTGTVGEISKKIRAYIKIEDLSFWDNVIFAGAGSAGTLINGNVDIRGSMHILGTSLESTDFAIDMGGNSNIGNNYEGMPAELLSRIPPCPTVMFGGESVESLGATLRIKRGKAGLSGSAIIGDEDEPENSYKETVDGVYVTDGYGGNKGEENVYSDNGAQNSYDLGDSVRFPSLGDSYLDDPAYTYQDYLRDNAYVYSGDLTITSGTPINPPLGGASGSISMDASGNLGINGIVYIEGDLTMQGGPITYTGKGAILSTGNVLIKSNLLTPVSATPTFPTNIIGIMTPNNITLGEAAQIDIMGAFYAENTIAINKQTNVLGSVVSNYFDMGGQVPNIYQVPELSDNLPEGMIEEDALWVIKIIAWQKL